MLGKRAVAGGAAGAGNLRAQIRGAQEKGKFETGRGTGSTLPPVVLGGQASPRLADGQTALPNDIAFLARFGVAAHFLEEAARISRSKGLAASEVLIARGWITRAAYGELLAAHFGFGHADAPANGKVANFAPRERDMVDAEPLLIHSKSGSQLWLAADYEQAAKADETVGDRENLRSQVHLVPAAVLRLARHMANAGAQSQRAAFGLARKYPQLSARKRFSRWQAATLMVLLPALVLAITQSHRPLVFAGLALTGFYLAAVLLRALMIWRLDSLPKTDWRRFRLRPAAPEDLPRYSILVALYREAGQTRALVNALSALEWPADRREVFLVCEEDDAETVQSIRELYLPAGFQLVLCPPSQPRTKPKALNFAMPLVTGEYVVIYDAEDRPHPLQLREAHGRFSTEGPGLACLQAPLSIHNGADNWLTAMFAIEYETLFRGILPILERFGGPLPLGGTSNHFRTASLRRAGEWDPWNVTEDADLGIRLARLGLACGTLTLPTWEEAPSRIGIWLRQRTRWLKGWIQTILVHSRNPLAMLREIGWCRTALFHLVLTSIVVSALSHPVFLIVFALEAFAAVSGTATQLNQRLLFALAAFNLAAGYTTYAFFAREVLVRNRLPGATLMLLTLPAYWLLISIAGWRAAWQFAVDPFRWEKTEHGLSNSTSDANMPVVGFTRI